MPKIAVYKSNGTIIPVNDAKLTKAYQCPWTARLFVTKPSYIKHLANLRTSRMHKAARNKINNLKFNNLINQPNFISIVNWVEMNPEFFYDRIYNSLLHKDIPNREDFWFKITFLSLNYSDCVSNTHSSPRGKRTQWGGTSTEADGVTLVPRGFPGWSGKIEYQLSHNTGFGSDVTKGTGINTGGGGSRGGKLLYGYECKMFLEDWPGLIDGYNRDVTALAKRNTLNIIAGKSIEKFSHKFEYGKQQGPQ